MSEIAADRLIYRGKEYTCGIDVAEAHRRTFFGKERILGIELEHRDVVVDKGSEERQVPPPLGTAQMGKNLLGRPPARRRAGGQALVDSRADLFQGCNFLQDFLSQLIAT
ncbi:hypothetical protein [Geobacter sp.]|uniref:hypothetical protein n=1 Tax=Geobacter sp. TaxID=46610 RepID=UPI00261A3686|nr:hypothetical protein [Geobacter sp.]